MVPWKQGMYISSLGCHMCRHFLPVTLPESSCRARRCGCTCAEEDKAKKYAHLDSLCLFKPVTLETGGTIGPKSRNFLKELGRRLKTMTGEAQSCTFLL